MHILCPGKVVMCSLKLERLLHGERALAPSFHMSDIGESYESWYSSLKESHLSPFPEQQFKLGKKPRTEYPISHGYVSVWRRLWSWNLCCWPPSPVSGCFTVEVWEPSILASLSHSNSKQRVRDLKSELVSDSANLDAASSIALLNVWGLWGFSPEDPRPSGSLEGLTAMQLGALFSVPAWRYRGQHQRHCSCRSRLEFVAASSPSREQF